MCLLGHLWRWVARGGDTLAGPVGAGFLWDTYGGPWGDTHGIACDQPTAADAVRENGAFSTVRSAGAWEKTPGYHFCDNQSDNQGHPPTQNRGGMYHPPYCWLAEFTCRLRRNTDNERLNACGLREPPRMPPTELSCLRWRKPGSKLA